MSINGASNGRDVVAELLLASEGDTVRFGGALAAGLPERCTVGLIGTLGAGKTRLVQSIAAAIGIPDSSVTSPTFTLVQIYETTTRTLCHVDAYRLVDEDEFLDLGVEELMERPDTWVLIEWADRVAEAMPEDCLWIRIEIDSEFRRKIILSGDPQIWTAAVGKVLEAMR